jgi:ferritin-like metal-binding protein YciE
MKAIEIIAQPAESKWMNAQIESFIEKRNRQIAKFDELFDFY